MQRYLWNYLKVFVIIGVAFSIFIYGSLKAKPDGLLLSLKFGVIMGAVMSLILGTVLNVIAWLGRGKTSSKSMAESMDYHIKTGGEQALELILECGRKKGWKLIKKDEGKVQFQSGMSLFSWGELITILIKPEQGTTKVFAESALKDRWDNRDNGRNRANLDALKDFFSQTVEPA